MPETPFPTGKRLLLLAFLFLLAAAFFLLQVVACFGLTPVKEVVSGAGAFPEANSPAPEKAPEKREQNPGPRAAEPAPAFPLPGAAPLQEPPPLAGSLPRQTPAAGSEIPGVLRSVPYAAKKVALTFDDGPFLNFTPAYLKVLQEQEVHATFFLVGRHIQRAPGLVGLIAQQGHEIGNHTFSHRNLSQVPLESARQDLLMTAKLIEQEGGPQVKFFRPPGGNLNPALVKMIREMGMEIALWNIDPKDWSRQATPTQIVNHILTRLQPGSIVLLHEGRPQTLAALPLLIKELKQRGWQLATLSELRAEHAAPPPKEQPEPSSGTSGAPLPVTGQPANPPLSPGVQSDSALQVNGGSEIEQN